MSTPPVMDHLRQSILLRLKGIERPLVDIELRAVTAEFLSRTLLWRIPYEFVPTVGADAYIIPIPQTGICISMLLNANYGTSPIRICDLTHLRTQRQGNGPPRAMALRDARTVQLWPAPDKEDQTVRFTAAMTVDLTESNPDEPFILPFEVYPFTNVLMDGLYSRLYAVPEMPWTSRILMEHHLRAYRRGLTEARLQADTGRTRDTPMPQFNRIL